MSTKSSQRNSRQSGFRQRGSALLTVLWLTAALSAIGLTVANSVRGETERTETIVDETKAYFAARGAIERAALHIQWKDYFVDGRPLFYNPGAPYMDLDFPEAVVRVDVIPETAKLNLNLIRPEALLQLLTVLGVPQDRATGIALAIADWRKGVDPVNPSPFDAFYLALSPSFRPRHTSFQENEELLLVRGMTPEIYYGAALGNSQVGLRDCVSVYGTMGSLDVNTAQPAALIAVGMPPEAVAAVVKIRAASPILDYRQFAALSQSLGTTGAHLRFGGQTMFTLRATARLKTPEGKLSDLRRTVQALVKFWFPQNRDRMTEGFEVLRWYDRA